MRAQAEQYDAIDAGTAFDHIYEQAGEKPPDLDSTQDRVKWMTERYQDGQPAADDSDRTFDLDDAKDGQQYMLERHGRAARFEARDTGRAMSPENVGSGAYERRAANSDSSSPLGRARVRLADVCADDVGGDGRLGGADVLAGDVPPLAVLRGSRDSYCDGLPARQAASERLIAITAPNLGCDFLARIHGVSRHMPDL
ncbi:MAG: hypothetical protein ACRDPL_11495, partial [Propionibacteriaceae bacterium]